MIVGLLLRNIKCYKGINFIPLVDYETETVTILTGGNGVGKSTVLESINYILNSQDVVEWEITIDEKKDRGFVCPVFLVDSEDFADDPKKKKISDVFWNADLAKFHQHGDWVKDFISWRDNLREVTDTSKKFLIPIGRTSKNDIVFTSTFHSLIENRKVDGMSKSYFKDLLSRILGLYSYIYIPVESSIKSILSIQAKEMQAMMDKRIIDEIKGILEKKSSAKESIMDIINKNLHEYIDGLNSKFHDGYKYQPRGLKKNLSTIDVTKLVVKEFFENRILTKNGKLITSLSSGQQRLALIDVATTMLSSDNNSKYIILSIDEPEASLEVSQRLKQFNRLSELSDKFGHQCFFTTHWYGMLLKPFNGHLVHIRDDEQPPNIKGFRLDSLFGKRSDIPDDIELKGFFDFMSSLISTMKSSDENWIICEGVEDAIYLKCYLHNKVKNLNIIPFNGCGNIRKLFRFLEIPFLDDAERSSIKGRIMCLVDTDERNLIIEQTYKNSSYGKKLNFSRISINREKDVSSIVSIANPNAINTEVEDLLHVKPYTETILHLSKMQLEISSELAEFLELYKVDYTNHKHAKTSRGLGPFKPKNMEGHERKDEFVAFLNSNKMKMAIAKSYPQFHSQHESEIGEMGWVSDIVDFFLK
ncbi:ATP-binding protein [Halomonas sp. NyZ770]|uniref:AAA family ATPase n=1 Tax=Halomonas sp. NyZ770 TaxID=2883106 RepID=UPI001D0B90BB|nr:AAA family ATPase [Halomonas sp. NyZ770]UDM05756.1 ATP-binding protein [Halomonas sp. NyZ770]